MFITDQLTSTESAPVAPLWDIPARRRHTTHEYKGTGVRFKSRPYTDTRQAWTRTHTHTHSSNHMAVHWQTHSTGIWIAISEIWARSVKHGEIKGCNCIPKSGPSISVLLVFRWDGMRGRNQITEFHMGHWHVCGPKQIKYGLTSIWMKILMRKIISNGNDNLWGKVYSPKIFEICFCARNSNLSRLLFAT